MCHTPLSQRFLQSSDVGFFGPRSLTIHEDFHPLRVTHETPTAMAAPRSPAAVVSACFSDHFDAHANAVDIGTCPCKARVFAHLDGPLDTLTTRCDNGKTHTWATTTLHPDLAYLFPQHPKRKTTKKLLLEQLKSWNHYRELAPDMDEDAMEMILYKKEVAVAGKGGDNGGDDDDDTEIIVRSQSLDLGASSDEERVAIAEVATGPIVFNDSSDEDKTQAYGLLHVMKDLCARYGPLVLRDIPVLLAAWRVQDAEYLGVTMLALLPKYFFKLPSWADKGITITGMAYFRRGLAHPATVGAFEAVCAGLGIAQNDPRLLTLPTTKHSDVDLANTFMAQANVARGRQGC